MLQWESMVEKLSHYSYSDPQIISQICKKIWAISSTGAKNWNWLKGFTLAVSGEHSGRRQGLQPSPLPPSFPFPFLGTPSCCSKMVIPSQVGLVGWLDPWESKLGWGILWSRGGEQKRRRRKPGSVKIPPKCQGLIQENTSWPIQSVEVTKELKLRLHEEIAWTQVNVAGRKGSLPQVVPVAAFECSWPTLQGGLSVDRLCWPKGS